MSSVSQFVESLRRSGLVESSCIDETLAAVESDAKPDQQEDPDFVADQFIRRNLLTSWQTRQLLKGRFKGFFLRQYKILGHIGSGGMSSVYLAEHVLMQRSVAVKVLPRKRLEKAIYLERFIREAQAIAALDHPSIIRAYDFDHEGDLYYIVMEYFPGSSLQTLGEHPNREHRHSLSFLRTVGILRQTADALAHAHAIGVIHRDVKPGNILVNPQGNVKVLDLGLALLDEQVYEGRITHIQEDTILGTADYLAPEQALDSHKVDVRADIYALGGVLYFCLTGHPPFPHGSVSKRLLDHQQSEPADVFHDRPDAPQDLVDLCKKMMSKNPDHRQQSAKEVVHDFEDWLVRHSDTDKGELTEKNLTDEKITEENSVEKSFAEEHSAGIGTFRVRVHPQKRPVSLPLTALLHDLPYEQSHDPLSENRLSEDNPSEACVSEEERDVLILEAVEEGASEEHVNLLGSEVESTVMVRSHRLTPNRKTSIQTEDSMQFPRNTASRDRVKRIHRDLVRPVLQPSSHSRLSSKKQLTETQKMKAVSAKPQVPENLKTENTEWYRHVPIWFWTLFFSGYVAAVFFAGILAALIVVFYST